MKPRFDDVRSFQEVLGSDGNHPITLSLTDKLTVPVNPLKTAPRITYQKSPGVKAKEASWIAQVDVIEDGKQVTYTITQGDEKLRVISIPDEAGSFSGEKGNWESTVRLFLQFSKARGRGKLRIALTDVNEIRPNENEADVRRLSNWLEIPIQIGP